MVVVQDDAAYSDSPQCWCRYTDLANRFANPRLTAWTDDRKKLIIQMVKMGCIRRAIMTFTLIRWQLVRLGLVWPLLGLALLLILESSSSLPFLLLRLCGALFDVCRESTSHTSIRWQASLRTLRRRTTPALYSSRTATSSACLSVAATSVVCQFDNIMCCLCWFCSAPMLDREEAQSVARGFDPIDIDRATPAEWLRSYVSGKRSGPKPGVAQRCHEAPAQVNAVHVAGPNRPGPSASVHRPQEWMTEQVVSSSDDES